MILAVIQHWEIVYLVQLVWPKNVNIDTYKSGYGIAFDGKGFFPVGNGVGQNVIIFGVDMSSSPVIDNKKKYILILGKGPTQGQEHTLSAEKNVFN